MWQEEKRAALLQQEAEWAKERERQVAEREKEEQKMAAHRERVKAKVSFSYKYGGYPGDHDNLCLHFVCSWQCITARGRERGRGREMRWNRGGWRGRGRGRTRGGGGERG